jgi:Domain of unknown function (DUF1707)
MTDVSVPVDPEQDPPSPQHAPAPRIGDAERDRAVGYLQEHMAQGRLDGAEFDERLTRALSARTEADLQPLFADLPEPRPSTGLATTAPFTPPPWASSTSTAAGPMAASPPGRRQQMPRAASIALAAVWPLTILIYVLTDFDNWWLFIAAAMVTYFLRRAFSPDPPPDDQQGPRSLPR